MEYTKKKWNEQHKEFRAALKKENTFHKAIELFMELHSLVHSSAVYGLDKVTFEDELWDNLDDITFRTLLNKKKRTIAYGIWHSTRIEDMTMNLLVTDGTQVIDENNRREKINSSIYDTGNALSEMEILEFSRSINMPELKKYRDAVGIRTRGIVSRLNYKDLKKPVPDTGLENILNSGAVLNKEESVWLVDYWRNKTTAGILLMPCTRHLMVHINESIEAKIQSRNTVK